MDSLKKIFQRLSDDIEVKGKINKSLTVQCLNVLNGTVRPAIRCAGEHIQSDRVLCCAEPEEPRILANIQHENADEIRFKCSDGALLEIIVTISGKSSINSVRMDDVSDILVAQQIDLFLRQVLNLPTSTNR